MGSFKITTTRSLHKKRNMFNIYTVSILFVFSKTVLADLAKTMESGNELADMLEDAFDSSIKISELHQSDAQKNFIRIYREHYEDLKGLLYQVEFEYSASSEHDLVQLVEDVTREFNVWRIFNEAESIGRSG